MAGKWALALIVRMMRIIASKEDDRDYTDRECKVACMAEALSPAPVPLEQVRFIYVKDHIHATYARQFVRSAWPRIEVNPRMFP